MLNFFGSSRLKAQRQAAKSTRATRELAGREASLEIEMLAKRMLWGAEQRDAAVREGRAEQAKVITLALADGQELFERLTYSVDPIVNEIRDMWRSAVSADQFEALVTHEQELRDLLVELRNQARVHLGAIGSAGIEVIRPTLPA